MKVFVLTYWSFSEPLVQAAALPYLRMIREVSGGEVELLLLTLEKPKMALRGEKLAATQASLASEGIRLITLPYYAFGFRAMLSWSLHVFRLFRICKREGVDWIHAFGSPIGLIARRLSRWTGIPFVIDSYEPHAESMVENGTWRNRSLAHRILFRSEQKQSEAAFAVLATTPLMQDYAQRTYGAVPHRFVTRPACVDLGQFSPETLVHPDLLPWKTSGYRIGIYAGKLGGIYMKEEVFAFMSAAQRRFGGKLRWVLLTDTEPREVHRMMLSAGIERSDLLVRKVPHADVPQYMAAADFAINPVRPVPSKRYCTSIKDGEYWAMGLPVVLPEGISDDSDLVREHQAGVVVEDWMNGSFDAALDALLELLDSDLATRKKRIIALARAQRDMSVARTAYHQLYGPDGWCRHGARAFTAVIYNSLRDPLFQNLVLRYLQEQVRRHPGTVVDVITFEHPKYAVPEDAFLPTRGQLWSTGIRWHPLIYHSGRFMLLKKAWDFLMAFALVRRILRQSNTQGLIAFANASAAITTVLGQRFNLPMAIYSFEPHSAFLAEMGIWKQTGLRHRVLHALEWKAAKRAKVIMTGTRYMVEELKGKTDALVMRAPSAVDPEVFQFWPEERQRIRTALNMDDRPVMIYAGKFGGLYGESELFAFFKALQGRIPEIFLLILTPHDHAAVRTWAAEHALSTNDFFVSEGHSPAAMSGWYSAADVGISTIPPLPNQRFRSPVKVGEYLLCGLPYITCDGVSEDGEVARSFDVGIPVEDLSATAALQAAPKLVAFLTESKPEQRLRCRNAGLSYRGIDQVHDAFETALRVLAAKT